MTYPYITHTTSLLTIFPLLAIPTKSAEHACSQRVEILYDSSPAPRKADYLWYYTSARVEELVVLEDRLRTSHKSPTSQQR